MTLFTSSMSRVSIAPSHRTPLVTWLHLTTLIQYSLCLPLSLRCFCILDDRLGFDAQIRGSCTLREPTILSFCTRSSLPARSMPITATDWVATRSTTPPHPNPPAFSPRSSTLKSMSTTKTAPTPILPSMPPSTSKFQMARQALKSKRSEIGSVRHSLFSSLLTSPQKKVRIES